jgi:hypothetical protein
MKTRQQGAGLLILVLLVVTVAAFAVIVAASQSGGDIQGSDANADSLQALSLAEAGVERALKRFATGTACGGALAEVITDLSTIGLGAVDYRITIGAGLTTDFAGAALVSSQTQCRVPVTGTIIASNVSRTIHAIVDKNLLAGTNNHNFNNPTTVGPPLAGSWVLAPLGTYAQNGGPDGALPCNRSAWIWKPAVGPGVAARTVGSGTTAIPTVPAVTVAAASTTTVHFHWRAVDRGAGCPAYPAGAPAFPCGGAGGADAQICFQLTSTAGGPWQSGRLDINPGAGGVAACPSTFNPCTTLYEVPNPPVYPTKDSLTIAHGAAVTLNGFVYFMRLQNANQREMFLDNIELVNPTALNAARVQVWRDCSTAANPATCT